MRPDSVAGVTDIPYGSLLTEIEAFNRRNKGPEDQPSLKMPPTPGAVIGAEAERFRDIPAGEVYVKEYGTSLPSPSARWANLPTGGQYTVDQEQSGQLIKIERDDPRYNLANERELARRGLSSRHYQIDHIMPFWAGGTDSWVNKMILTYDDHEKKTKIEKVARQLFYSGHMNIHEARNITLNWEMYDDSNIPHGMLTPISHEDAFKKYQEWKTDPNDGVFKRTADAFERWGFKEAVRTFSGEARQHRIESIEAATKNLGAAGVANRAIMDMGRVLPNVGIGVINFASSIANVMTPKKWDAQQNRYVDRFKAIKPIEPLSDVGMKPVEGYENIESKVLAGSNLTGHLSEMLIGMKAIGGVAGMTKKLNSMRTASQILAGTYKGKEGAAAASALFKTSKLMGKSLQPFKRIPILNQIKFTTGNIVSGSLLFGAYSQIAANERIDLNTRWDNFAREFAMGGLFGTVGTAAHSWKGITAGSAVVGSGSYFIARASGLSHEEAANEAYTMAALHFVLSSDQKIFGKKYIPMLQDDMIQISNKTARDMLNAFSKKLNIDGPPDPPGGAAGRLRGLFRRPRAREDMTMAELDKLRLDLLTKLEKQKEAGQIDPIPYQDAVTRIGDATTWLEISILYPKPGPERAEAVARLWQEIDARAGKSWEGTKYAKEALDDKMSRFYNANPEYANTGVISRYSQGKTGETVIPVKSSEIREAPVGEVKIESSTRRDVAQFENLRDLQRQASETPGGMVKVELVRMPETQKYIESQNKHLEQRGLREGLDKNPGSDVYIVGNIRGGWEPIGKLSGDVRTRTAAMMDKLGVDVVPSSIKMIETGGKWQPDIVRESGTTMRATVDLRHSNWTDAIRARTRADRASADILVSELGKTPRFVSEQRAVNKLVENMNKEFGRLSEITGTEGILSSTLGEIVTRAAGNPREFNKEFGKKGSKVLSDVLVEKLEKNPRDVKVSEIMNEVSSSYAQGRVKSGSPLDSLMITYKSYYDAAKGRGRTAALYNLKTLVRRELGEISQSGEAPRTAPEAKTAEAIAEGMSSREGLIKRTQESVRKASEKIAEKIRQARPVGKEPHKLTPKEAAKAPKNIFEQYIYTKGKTDIQNAKDLKDTKDVFDALMLRGDTFAAKNLKNRIETVGKDAKLEADVNKAVKDMESRLKAAEVREAAKKRPETAEKKVAEAIKDRPKVQMQLELKTAETPRKSEVRDNAVEATQKEVLSKDTKQINEEIAKAKREDAELDRPRDTETTRLTDPVNIADPVTKAEAVSYNHFFEYSGNSRLTYGDTYLSGKIAEARLKGDFKQIEGIKADQKKFERQEMEATAKTYKNKHKEDPQKAAEEFIGFYEKILAKHGDKDSLSSFNNRQMLKHRYQRLAEETPRNTFHLEITKTGADKLIIKEDPVKYPKSSMQEKIEAYKKTRPDYQDGAIYFDASRSSEYLGKKGLGDLVTVLNREGYVVLGRPKNSLESFWAVKRDQKIIDEVRMKPEEFLPPELLSSMTSDGRLKRSVSDNDAFLWGFYRKVLGMHNKVDANVVFERAQLYDSKEIKNQVSPDLKYNVVIYDPKGTLGETTGKKLTEWSKGKNGDEVSLKTQYDRIWDDGAMYITAANAKEIGLNHGFIKNINTLKPTQDSRYTAPDGSIKAMLQKGQMWVMDAKLQAHMEKQLGRKINKYDIISNTNNLKFGLENRLGDLKAGKLKYIEQEVPADSFRFKYQRPQQETGSFGPGAWAKIPMNSAESAALMKMYEKPMNGFMSFVNQFKAPADGKQIIANFKAFGEKYHIDIPKHMYKEIVASFQRGAGMYDHSTKLNNIFNRLFAEHVLSGGFLSRSHMHLVPDYGVLTGGRFLRQGEVMISRKAFNDLFSRYVEKGEVTRSPEGYMVWTKTGKPVELIDARYPVNGLDNATASRIFIGEHYGVRNLGKDAIIKSHEDVYVRKNGDYDGDTVHVFASGAKDNMIPEILAKAVNRQPVLISTQQAGAKRPRMPLSEANLIELSSRVWLGDKAIKNTDTGARVAEIHNDAGTRLEAKMNDKGDREIFAFFGNSTVPYKGEPIHIQSGAQLKQHRIVLEDSVATIRYGNEQRQLLKTLNSWGTDAAKNDFLFNWFKTEGYNPKSGFSKDIIWKTIFVDGQGKPLQDKGIIQALHKLDKDFQLINQMAKGKNFDPVETNKSLAEGKKTEIDIAAEQVKWNQNVETMGKMIEAITAGGGSAHPSLKIMDHMQGWKMPPDYTRDMKTQHASDAEGRGMTETIFPQYSIKALGKKKDAKLTPEEIRLLEGKVMLQETRNTFNKFTANPRNNSPEWVRETVEAYDLFRSGAKDYYSRNEGKILNEADWVRKSETGSQAHWKYPGQTYTQYLEGTSGVGPEVFRIGVASDARKRMLNELKKMVQEDLSQEGIDKLVHYLVTSVNGNIKDHPKWSTNNEFLGRNLVWRYHEIIPYSPAISEVYYTARNRSLGRDKDGKSSVLEELTAAGRSAEPMTTQEALDIAARYNKMPPSEKEAIRREVDAYRESMEIFMDPPSIQREFWKE